MGNNYLSEVLKGQDIIAEASQRICIISGVGSGKNRFVENELVQYGNILYISSRRAKVNEILENNLCSDKIQWEKETSDIVSVTNYGIERMVQNKKFGHNLREIINHFDFVVVDEAHSLLTDATYADSSFHVFAFIEYVIAQYPKIKVILMTGTPEPIERYLTQKGYTIFDKRDECIHVLPKVIRVINKDFAFECIGKMPDDEKTVYYSNSATQIVSGDKSLVKRLCEMDFTSDEIGICVSEQSAKRLKKEYKGLKEKCAQTKEAILKKRMLPEKCRILLTTSCLKEGVNIENDNIKIAFCESHVPSEIQQFAGRIRKGLDVLYIIFDARQHLVTDDELHQHYLELCWYYADVVENGWVQKKEIVRELPPERRILIVTEGSSDSYILKEAINQLFPDISDFFDFVDMKENYPFTGTGSLYNFCMGLCRINIQNNIVAIFDNDTAGLEKYHQSISLKKPSSFVITKLPDLPVFSKICTVGPQGNSEEDINGKAVAIECFLDFESVASTPCIRWTTYNKNEKQYQGELVNKDEYVRAFKQSTLTDGSYDVSKLRMLIDYIIERWVNRNIEA